MSLVCSIFIGEFFAKRFETFNIVVNVCLKETLRGRRMSLVECRISCEFLLRNFLLFAHATFVLQNTFGPWFDQGSLCRVLLMRASS